MATKIGIAGFEDIWGTNDAVDGYIYGLGGNDTLEAGDGNDRFYGGPGSDKPYGQDGDPNVDEHPFLLGVG